MYKPHTRCRACSWGPPITAVGIKGGESKDRLIPVFSLGIQPLANDFVAENEERSGYAPLEVLLCPRCHLGQLSVVVRPEILYKHYAFESFASDTMIAHFERLLIELGARSDAKSVVEIGSNNGLFLEYLKQHGTEHVLGIDPAENMVDGAKKRGVNSLCSLFDIESARMAAGSIPKVDLIVARHVFAHADDWQAFVHALRELCSKETTIYIEVPYAQWILDKTEFDTIYHEHLSYVTVKSMQYLLEGTGLRLTEVLSFKIHGGAIGLIIHRHDSNEPVNPSVQKFIENEECGEDAWWNFSDRSKGQIGQLADTVIEAAQDGKRVAGYGASAKSTVWLNAMRVSKSSVYGVYDNTRGKLYKQIPGTNIPVIHEGGFFVDNPDVAVLFSWNYAGEIQEKQRKWIEGGGQFITPVSVKAEGVTV